MRRLAPTFLVAALKDPIGANLDRYQIVKGWLAKDGKLHEKVYDVAWSGARKPDAKTGKVPAVGGTVDVANASWTNTLGAPELIAVWEESGTRRRDERDLPGLAAPGRGGGQRAMARLSP